MDMPTVAAAVVELIVHTSEHQLHLEDLEQLDKVMTVELADQAQVAAVEAQEAKAQQVILDQVVEQH